MPASTPWMWRQTAPRVRGSVPVHMRARRQQQLTSFPAAPAATEHAVRRFAKHVQHPAPAGLPECKLLINRVSRCRQGCQLLHSARAAI